VTFGVAFSPVGRTLATADDDSKVRLWNLRDRPVLGRRLAGMHGSVNAVAFSPDGRWLAASAHGSVGLWDARAAQIPSRPAQLLKSHQGDVAGLAFSPDGDVMATAGGNTILLWKARNGRIATTPFEKLEAKGESVSELAFSPDGHT